MGKRTAIEADMVDHHTHDHAPRSVPMTSTSNSLLNSPDPVRSVLVSPVPCAWQHIPDQNVEPHGACHMRVRTASRIKTTQPSRVQRDDVFTTITHTLDDDSVLDDDSDPMTELSMTLPPLVAPRPRRVVSPDLIFQSSRPSHYHSEPEKNETLPDLEAMHSMTIRRRAFRPIGAGRPDVDITSPPPRAMNPVVLDARFKNMQRLDLALDAQEAPLQPFHRPCPQRRVPSVGVHGVPVVPVAKIVPLDRDHMLTTANSV